MKNLSKLSLLIVFLSIFISTPVFALTTPINKATPVNGVLLASVNISNAKIVSQKGNIFNISFSLSNGAGLQTGVKYGVKLVQESKTGQMMIDERVYDESLTLNPNMTTKKEIVYTAPASLSGSYTLMLVSNNSSGFPFGIANLGKVTLTATSVGIQILPETCKLQTSDITQRINVNLGESISLTCEAMNSSKVDITVTPSYEVHSGTSFGDIIAQSGGSTEPITFKAGEKKSFSVSLPKATIPQIYNVNFTLNDKENKSNSIDINYIVLGVNTTINNISLDKDYYNKGDIALLSLIYKSNSPSPITSKIQISNGKGKSCAEPQIQTFTQPTTTKVDTSIIITSSCVDPKISVTLTDDKGTVLAQKEFNVKTTSAVPVRTSSSAIIYIILALLVIIALYIYFKKKKNTPPSNPVSSTPTESASVPMGVLFFFLLIASFGMIPIHKASADTVLIDNNFFATLELSFSSGGYSTSDPIGQDKYISASGSFECINNCWGTYLLARIDGLTGDAGLFAGDSAGFYGGGALLNYYASGGTVFTPPVFYNPGWNSVTFTGSTEGTYFTYDMPFYYDPPATPVVPPAPVTVTVYANGKNPLTVKSTDDVKITWNVANLAPTDQCFCTYAGTKGDCGSSTGSGSDKGGSTIKLPSTKTITVTCTN